jgi:hypothetical protein
MHDAHECHRKAEALATLALMFPESAERYRAKEQHWRDLEAQAQRKARTPDALSGSGQGRPA